MFIDESLLDAADNMLDADPAGPLCTVPLAREFSVQVAAEIGG
jgi:hypothetical protein